MNWNQIEGNRDQLKGKVKEQYGISQEEAEREVDEWGTRDRV